MHSTLILAAVWVLGLLLLACLFVLRLIERQVTQPVAELARFSEAVASGELSVPFTPSRVNSEVGRLSRATSGMIVALRRLASTMRASARDTTTLSAQITAASESVAMAAQQTASTSSALSKESSLMARTIKEIADDASKLERVGRSRESAARTLSSLQTVHDATHHGGQSFMQVEQGVIDPEKWSASIETAVEESNRLVVDMNQRLDNLALGTEGFASAMHQVATASEEQSDSIDEIAGAANSLSSAARRVAQLVGTFKLGDTPSRGMPAVQNS